MFAKYLYPWVTHGYFVISPFLLRFFSDTSAMRNSNEVRKFELNPYP